MAVFAHATLVKRDYVKRAWNIPVEIKTVYGFHIWVANGYVDQHLSGGIKYMLGNDVQAGSHCGSHMGGIKQPIATAM